MNLRTLLPLLLLSSAFALSACGNKGPLLPPPAPDEDEWPEEQVDDSGTGVDSDADIDPDLQDDAEAGDPAAGADDSGDGGA
ncbi:MAG TPA: lipoprotein [Luteimonas sp.]